MLGVHVELLLDLLFAFASPQTGLVHFKLLWPEQDSALPFPGHCWQTSWLRNISLFPLEGPHNPSSLDCPATSQKQGYLLSPSSNPIGIVGLLFASVNICDSHSMKHLGFLEVFAIAILYVDQVKTPFPASFPTTVEFLLGRWLKFSRIVSAELWTLCLLKPTPFNLGWSYTQQIPPSGQNYGAFIPLSPPALALISFPSVLLLLGDFQFSPCKHICSK